MKTINDHQLDEIVGGGDSFAKDLGQFIGGATGWIEANLTTYLFLGPGIGGLAAINAGVRNAEL